MQSPHSTVVHTCTVLAWGNVSAYDVEDLVPMPLLQVALPE